RTRGLGGAVLHRRLARIRAHHRRAVPQRGQREVVVGRGHARAEGRGGADEGGPAQGRPGRLRPDPAGGLGGQEADGLQHHQPDARRGGGGGARQRRGRDQGLRRGRRRLHDVRVRPLRPGPPVTRAGRRGRPAPRLPLQSHRRGGLEGPMRDVIAAELGKTIANFQAMAADPAIADGIVAAVGLSTDALRGGHRLLIAGNGGSAADAQHWAGELVSRFYYDRPGLAAIALTTDSSILTAIGNDYGYDYVFARQVEALGQAGDVLFAISTSGRSPNILRAVEAARARGMRVVGFTGNGP